MIRIASRPRRKRGEFEMRADPHRRALRALTRNGEPDYAAINAYLRVERNQIWGGVKDVFYQAQNGKCAYCEVPVTTSHGDLEHYRPKSAVWHLVEGGRELRNSVKARGRNPDRRYDSGYWWLAYDWNNYLFVCSVCNRTWKSAFFPVTKRRTRRVREGDEVHEGPLLLNPFDGADPAGHLAFDETGQIEAYRRSLCGRKTIETCGLGRESLRVARMEKAVRTHALIRRLTRAESDERRREILQDLCAMGDSRYPHAGMVRSIFVQETGHSWSQLEAATARWRETTPS